MNRWLRLAPIGLFLAGLIIQAGWNSMLIYVMLSRPGEPNHVDFIHFYAAGRIVQQQGYSHAYDLPAQKRIEQSLNEELRAQDEVLVYNHLPILLPLLKWIVDGDYLASYTRWVLLNAAVLAAAAGVIGLILRAYPAGQASVGAVLLCVLAFYPATLSLVKGQDTSLVLFGAAVWVWGLLTGRDLAAGLGLVFMLLRPQYGLMLALPFIFHRRRVLYSFVIGAALVAAACFWLIGPQGTRQFISVMLISAQGQAFGFHPQDMFNLAGLLVRAFPGFPPAGLSLVKWVGFAVAALALCAIWRRRPPLGLRLTGLALLLALFFSPHLYDHDLTLLVLPLVGATVVLWEGSRVPAGYAALLTLGVSLALTAGALAGALEYWVGYAAMAGAAAALFYRPANSPSTASASSARFRT